MDTAKIDKNFAIAEVDADGVEFYDVRKEPFKIYGLYNAKSEPYFKRLPDEIGMNVNEGVKRLYKHTAGGRVRFSTDSSLIAISVKLHESSRFAHMPFCGTMGFDLYIDSEDGAEHIYSGTFFPPVAPCDSYCAKVTVGESKKRFYTLNLPSYTGITELFIGVEAGASLDYGLCYKNTLPVVYYGSSITQGACACRSGNSYQDIISRSMGLDYINLGFAGNGRAEDTIVDYMAGLDMCAFVSDYDHNAPNAEYLESTHRNMYRKIREKHPNIPYIMISKPDFDKDKADARKRRDAILRNFNEGIANGDKNLYFIDGETFFRAPYRESCTVDGIHPNDLGFGLMADLIEKTLTQALSYLLQFLYEK